MSEAQANFSPGKVGLPLRGVRIGFPFAFSSMG
jgi:hypothetical protein